ncbi:MAG: asparagine synthase (glutamine-hydrolyzing) [Xanthomonadales bacterium]|nr:asparagine synthase (glutamine-hydrolyzing) [Xanthomonadales bacterium]
MCGINGIFSYHYASRPVDVDELRRTRDAMYSRGPDGAGEWHSRDHRVSLAHRRLKIIDLSDAAKQPMQSGCGRFVVSLSGEIFNYAVLRRELEGRGYPFRTESDTEVLLAMFAEFGTRMFGRLRGMYAFAIWDRQERRLLLARDPFGIKPLYLANDGWTLRFASQVQALRAGGAVSDQSEPAAAAGFFLFGFVPEPFTQWQEIRSLSPGCYTWVDALGPGPETSHFDWPAMAQIASGTRAPGEIAEAVRDSVTAHSVGDVPVGLLYSGGIDSSALSQLGGQAAQRIHVHFQGLPRPAFDNADVHVRTVTVEEFEADLPLIISAMDVPSIDGVNCWFAAKACREMGLKSAIIGVGGDELWAGYPAFRDVPGWHRRLGWMRWLPGMGRLAGWGLAGLSRVLGLHSKLEGVPRLCGTQSGSYVLRRALHLPWRLGSIIERDWAALGMERLDLGRRLQQMVPASWRGKPAAVFALESRVYLSGQLLRTADWAGFAHGVEFRMPYLDPALWRQCLGHAMAVQHRHHGAKSDLARAAGLAWQDGYRKQGFVTPFPAMPGRSYLERMRAWSLDIWNRAGNGDAPA